MDNIPDIYSDSYSSNKNKNDLEIIDLINDDINNLIKDRYFNITEYELFDTYNKSIIVCKTNYNKDFILETDKGRFNVYNNNIFFPKSKERIIFSIYNDTNNDFDTKKEHKLDDTYYNLSILKLYKYTINKYKYNIISKDDSNAGISKYYTLFEQKYKNEKIYTYCTFTINIFPKNKKDLSKLIKIQSKDLSKLIKIHSKEYVFIYEPQLNANNTIVLYLIRIKNINTDETIKIDIHFTNIESIYQKYESAIDQLNTFLFDKNKKFTYNENQILKYIKGKIYPDLLYAFL